MAEHLPCKFGGGGMSHEEVSTHAAVEENEITMMVEGPMGTRTPDTVPGDGDMEDDSPDACIPLEKEEDSGGGGNSTPRRETIMKLTQL